MAGDARSDGWGMLYQREVDAVCHAVNAPASVVYFALVSMRNARTGETPPVGTSLIAAKTGQGLRTAQRGVKALEDSGVILRVGIGPRPRYRFPILESDRSDAKMRQICRTEHK